MILDHDALLIRCGKNIVLLSLVRNLNLKQATLNFFRQLTPQSPLQSRHIYHCSLLEFNIWFQVTFY